MQSSQTYGNKANAPITAPTSGARNINSRDDNISPSEIAVGVVIGRASEYFDFFVYAIASVLVFPAVFFPFADRLLVRGEVDVHRHAAHQSAAGIEDRRRGSQDIRAGPVEAADLEPTSVHPTLSQAIRPSTESELEPEAEDDGPTVLELVRSDRFGRLRAELAEAVAAAEIALLRAEAERWRVLAEERGQALDRADSAINALTTAMSAMNAIGPPANAYAPPAALPAPAPVAPPAVAYPPPVAAPQGPPPPRPPAPGCRARSTARRSTSPRSRPRPSASSTSPRS